MAVVQSIKNLLLSGPPGCGKTTVIRRLLERLPDLRLAGFYTKEMRERGQRVGFEIIGLSGRRAVLGHVRSSSRHRVGRYGVDPAALEAVVQAELIDQAGEANLIVIDEIGKMELTCPSFVEVVPRLLDGGVPVVATVALHGSGLIAQVKARDDVRLVEVAGHNREQLPEKLESWLRQRLTSR
jgi:nucleoside-triphosphatase